MLSEWRALYLVSATFFLLAAYVTFESISALLVGYVFVDVMGRDLGGM